MDRGAIGRVILVAGATVALAGCLGGASREAAPTSTVRASVVTAPADLQLLCASEAATRFSADPNQVLPVASRQTESGIYEVSLTVAGAPATCVVDDDANISTLQLVSA